MRRVALVVCAAGVAGMIATSIVGRNGAAITFGLVTAVAVLCSMVATAVTAASPGRTGEPSDAEEVGAAVEARVAELVAAGADEAAVRDLVGEAVRLGRSRSRA